MIFSNRSGCSQTRPLFSATNASLASWQIKSAARSWSNCRWRWGRVSSGRSVTMLVPRIGYDRATKIAKESAKTGKTVREVCREKKVLPEAELNRALDLVAMTEPGGEGSSGG